MKLRQIITTALALCLVVPGLAMAAGGGADLEHFERSDSKRSLQRGARTFFNYCMGCHTADYHRYNRMAKDIGLSDEFVLDNMVFTTDAEGEQTKVGSLMANNMSKSYAKKAFGVQPPNLALVSKSRGVDWLYTFLKSFYHDPSRPYGANNVVFPQVGMPHVLADLQGWQTAKFEEHDGHETFEGFVPLTAGTQSAAEYERTVRDLVGFLDYLGDPNRATRHAVGFWVMLFLLVFTVLAYLLKKEYWKDVRH